MKNSIPPLDKLDQKLQETRKKNFSDSLEQSKEQLRDAYMNFKDLQQRCTVEFKDKRLSDLGHDEHQVFYFKPETFLLDDAEKQRQYRENLINQIGTLPKPDSITYFGDELHREMCQAIADRSTPKATKKILAQFFQRRQYGLQHMKYKLLCRWAHHTLTSESLEKITPEATFMYGKLELNFESSVSRQERLNQDDYFDSLKPEQRPSTKADFGGGAMYVENVDLAPQSLIREDDVEIFLRATTYRNKINKVMNKFLSRLKWLPMQERYNIFEKSIQDYNKLKQANIHRQKMYYEKVQSYNSGKKKMTIEAEQELNEVLNGYYCSQYEKFFQSNVERLTHSWKANHDEVPRFISDNQLLKIMICERALKFNITGDIDLDRGYSFSYQVTSFFPLYFQRQVAKAQFSVYDSFGEDMDQSDFDKISLSQMVHFDTNIFRDVSTQKASVPSDKSIRIEFQNADVKILRLKSASYWIHYVILLPTQSEWQLKQQAILDSQQEEDKLLRNALNLLDLHDTATINQVLESSSNLHRENVIKLRQKNPHDQIKVVEITTPDGSKQVNVDLMPLVNSLNVSANIEQHLLSNLQSGSQKASKQENEQQKSRAAMGEGSGLRSLPQHYLSAYFTLRFMESRDAKTKILYTLNYFRSIQKRLALDLREFGTRDRIDGAFANPLVQSQEANSSIVNQVRHQSSGHDTRVQKEQYENLKKVLNFPKMTVFDDEAIKNLNDMASLRGYKCNGLFNNKVYSTCPSFSFPQMHGAIGEPIVRQPDEEEKFVQSQYSVSEQAVKLMNRIDFIEINEQLREVYVKDDFGIYIIYDCVLQDMKFLEDELCKVGSYFLHKAEVLLDPNSKPIPSRDRQELLVNLLVKEAEFQFQKVKLCQVYMECYEHITDPLEQQRTMQIITDIMGRRPRLNLNANYFVDAYDAEIECLKQQFEVIKMLVDFQIRLEKTENKRLQESLSLSYQLSNLYSKYKWKYQDAEALLYAIEKTKQEKKQKEQFAKKLVSEVVNDIKKAQNLANTETSKFGNGSSQTLNSEALKSPKASIREKHLEDGLSSHHDSDLDETDVGKEENNVFTKLLGLPTISIETVYQNYKENDVNVLTLMKEQNNFITAYEGYPEFLTMLTHGSIFDKNKIFKPNLWSQETGALDFYDTLEFINKYYALTLQIQEELYDGLKLWDATLMTQIDIQVARYQVQEFRQIINFQDGTLREYEGRHLVEDETIVGNCEKVIFYAKEMVSDLTFKKKEFIDPFIVAKLDVQSIFYFQFPKIDISFNKYSMRMNGISGNQYVIKCEKEAIAQIAKDITKSSQEKLLKDWSQQQNLQAPCLLQIYCNIMELLRIRQEIILAATETVILTQIYKQQCDLIGEKNIKVEHDSGIPFTEQNEDPSTKFINFVEDGPSHMHKIELAIKEFDPTLLSNFNFTNPDSLKLNILTSGLEEVRAILQYQLFQKHLLIIATRIQSLIIDIYERAISELNIIGQQNFCIPNSLVNYSDIMNRGTDSVNHKAVQNIIQKYKIKLASNCKPLLFNIITKKNQQRSTITKEFQSYKTKVQQVIPWNDTTVNRVMRCYRVKLLTRFVQSALCEIYLDAQKIQAVQTCKRLRLFNRFFEFDPKDLGMNSAPITVFKYETNDLLENFTQTYLPEQFKEEEHKKFQIKTEDYKCMRPTEYQIIDYRGIPSSASLLLADSSPKEDIRLFKQKRLNIRKQTWADFEDKEDLMEQSPDLSEPEQHLKRMLPTFTHSNNQDSVLIKKIQSEEVEQTIETKLGKSGGFLLDYEEALYFGDSQYSKMIQFYQSMERILTIEWFIKQLQFRSEEVVHFNHAIECGLPFFFDDEFDSRAKTYQRKLSQSPEINQNSQEFYFDQIVSIRQKRSIAESIQSLGLMIKNLIGEFQKTKVEKRFEYLSQYTEFRYQQVIGSLQKVVQNFYYQKNIPAVKTVQQSIAQLTKIDHVRLVHLKPNNFSIMACAASPNCLNLEPGNFIYGALNHDDMKNFFRCVQPVLNEKALEPPQVSLFQSLYQSDNQLRIRTGQFAGQFVGSKNSVALKGLQTALINLNIKERKCCQSFIVMAKFQANDFMESVYDDHSMSTKKEEDVYSLSQILLAKKFINESGTALLLRNALMCWFENSVLPDSTEKYEQFESNFRQNFFWKQLEQKEEITKKMQMNNTLGVSVPSEEQIKELKEKIDRLVNDQTLATQNATNERDQMVKALREEFNVLKKKVILDNYFNTKAEISVFRSEIQKLLIQASIQTLESESAALAKCFTIQVPSIQYHIHPFQQFAATLFDKVDPNSNLDVCNKVNIVQEFLTKIRNRCTEVDTLTSGPGIMITIKDFNEILVDFCRATITDNQKQFKSRAETSSIIESHYRQSIYTKDQKIKNLENRISNIANNLNVIITSRLFEKGNALVYELDHSNRILQVFKDTMKDFEKNLVERIQGLQLEKFKRQNNHVELKNLKFQDYKQTILNMVSADFAGEQERIKTIIKEKADQAKILDKDVRNAELQMYPASGTNTKACPKCNGNSSFAGAVVPKGFTHYTHCICYKPDPRYPHPTLELAELDILSEFEARSELKQMCIFMRKQRILYRTKEMCLMSKYQNKINMLEGQQSNNSLLWNQLAESEKREKILKQELVKTQSLLGEAHKKFDNLTTEIKSLDAERCRLQNFKTRKFKRLQELEDRVKKIDVFEALSQDKLISSLAKRDSQVTTMQSSFDTLICQLKQAESRRDKDVSHYRKKLMAEQARTQSICEKMEQLQIELKMMSQNDSSVTAIWKGKCLDLFEVCTVLRKDNEDLKNRCINLINQGLQLYDTVAGGPQLSSALDDPVSSKHNLSVSSRQGNSQLPGLNNSNHNFSVMQQKQRQGLLETMRSVTPQYNNKMLTTNQQKDSRDTSRNLRYNSQQLSYISQGIHSDETNVQTNSALRKTQQEIKTSEGLSQYELVTPIGEVSRNRGMSTGQTNIIDSVQSIKGQPNSIRQILGNFTDQILSEIPAKKIEQKHSLNQTHQQLKKMNPASLGSIQDSLFHPQNSMTSTQPQNFNTNRQKQIQKNTAIQQLKEASRFSKPQTSFKQQKPFEVNAVQYQKFSHTFQTPEPTQITNYRKVVLPKSQNLNDQVNEDSYSPDPASPVILQSMEIKSLIQATRDE